MQQPADQAAKAIDNADVNNADDDSAAPTVTPELVRVIADKVYALWLKDLQTERDRLGQHASSRFYYQRGR